MQGRNWKWDGALGSGWNGDKRCAAGWDRQFQLVFFYVVVVVVVVTQLELWGSYGFMEQGMDFVAG
jgi:ABC-type methionine transport system permease subunit